MRSHGRLRIRPCPANDARSLDAVFAGLSPRSRYQRYHAPVSARSPAFRDALLAIDPPRHVAYVADIRIARCWQPVGLARYVVAEAGRAEFAFEVVDAFQGRGIGTRLLDALRLRATEDGVRELHGEILADNAPAISAVNRAFTRVHRMLDGPKVHLVCPLSLSDETLTLGEILADLSGPHYVYS